MTTMASQQLQVRSGAGVRPRSARVLPIVALAGGLAAIAAGIALWSHSPRVDEAPYRYVVEPALSAERAQALRGITERGIALEQGRVVVAGDGQAVADFVVARSSAGRVLLDWRAQVDEPFLRLLPQPGEMLAVADTIRRHLPPDGIVIAWWDTSRALQLLAGLPVVFDRDPGETLIVPALWRAQQEAIAQADRSFLAEGASSSAEGAVSSAEGKSSSARSASPSVEGAASPGAPSVVEQARFGRFVDALLSDERAGIEALRELVAGRPAVVVLHARDVLLLGALDPQRIGVAFRDLPTSDPSHAAIRGVRDWMSSNGWTAYTVLQREGRPLRAVALTDDASGETLAARLLPFIGNRQEDVPGATLVYRTGAFVVFELETRSASDAASAGARTFTSLSK